MRRLRMLADHAAVFCFRVLPACLLAAACPLALMATAWGEVGNVVQEDTRSIAFGRVDSATIYVFAGQNRYGVQRSVTYDNGGIWEPWEPTALDEFALWEAGGGTSEGLVSVVNVVATAPGYGVSPLILAGTSGGDIFKSMDHGDTWVAIPGLPGNGVTDIAVHENGDILACTRGDGIYQSLDGGDSFVPLAFEGTGYFTSIVLHPDYDTNGSYFTCTESDGFTSGQIYQGIGATLIDLSTGLPGAGAELYGFASAGVASSDPGHLLLGDTLGHGIMESFDGGVTWVQGGLSCERIYDIAVSPDYTTSDRTTYLGSHWGLFENLNGTCEHVHPRGLEVYSVVPDPNWEAGVTMLWLATSDGIRRTIPGETYTDAPGAAETTLFDISALAPSPQSATDSYIFAASERFGVFLSENDGQTFRLYMPSLANASSGASMDITVTGLALSPSFVMGAGGTCNSDTSRLFIATNGMGMLSSNNAGATWSDFNAGPVESLPSSVCSVMHTMNPPGGEILFAGTCLGGGVYRSVASAAWWEGTALPDDGGSPPETPEAVTVIEAPANFGVSASEVFAGTDLGLYHSLDQGVTWSFISGLPNPSAPDPAPVTSIGIHPLFDMTANRELFVARGGRLYRGGWNAGTWEWTDLTDGSHGLDFIGASVVALSPLYGSDQTLALGYDVPDDNTIGGVYLSSDGGDSFAFINGSGSSALGDMRVQSLAFMATNGSPLRLVCGTNKHRVFFCDDFTSPTPTWAASEGWRSSPEEIRAMAVSPVPPSMGCSVTPTAPGTDVFIGGDRGVFWSNDGGQTFRPINEGMTGDDGSTGCVPMIVTALFAFENPLGTPDPADDIPMLLAGSMSHGIWFRFPIQDAETGAWDWTGGVWQQTNVTSGQIHRFTSEVAGGKIHAAGAAGGWITTDSLVFGQSWAGNGLTGNVTDIAHGRDSSAGAEKDSGPKAPSGGTTWGTVSGTGVRRGFEAGSRSLRGPLDTTWETRMGDGAGALEETQLQAVIQLESATVLTGTETDATDLGVFRTEDEGLQIWGRSDHGLEGTSGDIRDFLEQAVALDARDTFCAVNGTTDGGIFLSADDGRHWIGISEGFDPDNQTLSSIISDGGTPPTYYAGTYSHGSYATTIQPLDPPSISGLDVSSGSAAGGTSVTVTGSNFLCSCPEDYDCLPGQEQTIVSFGGADGATDTCTTTSLTVTTNAHAPGLVDVTVRNPDTRSDTLGAAFTFEGTPGISITLDRDVSNNVEISWTGGSPATVYRSHRPDFAWGVIQDTLSSNPYTYSDASGTDSNLYFYRVE